VAAAHATGRDARGRTSSKWPACHAPEGRPARALLALASGRTAAPNVVGGKRPAPHPTTDRTEIAPRRNRRRSTGAWSKAVLTSAPQPAPRRHGFRATCDASQPAPSAR
jgi:hypothetical protein